MILTQPNPTPRPDGEPGMLVIDTPVGAIRHPAGATASPPPLIVGPLGEMPARMCPTPARAVLAGADSVLRQLLANRPLDRTEDAVATGRAMRGLHAPEDALAIGYHVAPAQARATISTEGLLPSAPNPRWAKYGIAAQPAGVYVWSSLGRAVRWAQDFARLYAGSSFGACDIWGVDLLAAPVERDPLLGDQGAFVTPGPVAPVALSLARPAHRHKQDGTQTCTPLVSASSPGSRRPVDLPAVA